MTFLDHTFRAAGFELRELPTPARPGAQIRQVVGSL